MPNRNVETGIAAIQAGNTDEGRRLLKIALKEADVTGTMRAIACLWLAEIEPDAAAKRAYYDAALDADPGNAQIRSRYDAWMTTQLMPPSAPPSQPASNPSAAADPPPPQPPELPGMGGIAQPPSVPGFNNPAPATTFAPQQPAPRMGSFAPSVGASSGSYHIVSVLDGPNGMGTAFFVAREGLLATTRYVVGGADQLTIQLETGRQIPGYIVRAFPEVDLAFIYVEQSVNDLMPITPLPGLADNTPLMVISSNGQVAQGRRRTTKRALPPQWFPTDIVLSALPDAGGCPVLDDQRYLVGMATRNTASTSSYVYGLHINTIRQYVEVFRGDTMGGNRLYCPHCGYYSQATASGGYYCERCGALTPQAERITRVWQPGMSRFYQEQSNIKCRHCNASVGFYKGACLRCGRAASP